MSHVGSEVLPAVWAMGHGGNRVDLQNSAFSRGSWKDRREGEAQRLRVHPRECTYADDHSQDAGGTGRVRPIQRDLQRRFRNPQFVHAGEFLPVRLAKVESSALEFEGTVPGRPRMVDGGSGIRQPLRTPNEDDFQFLRDKGAAGPPRWKAGR